MSMRQPARNKRSEAETIVGPPPVHLRRWTARPHGVEFLSQLGTAVLRAVRRAYVRVEAVVETTAVGLVAQLRILRLAAEVRLLEVRRRSAMRLLGEAAYAGDEEEVERCRSHIGAIEAEVESRREQKVAVRAAAAQHSKHVLAGSRATEVHEPEPRGRGVPSAG
jgi:hypothetical protein